MDSSADTMGSSRCERDDVKGVNESAPSLIDNSNSNNSNNNNNNNNQRQDVDADNNPSKYLYTSLNMIVDPIKKASSIRGDDDHQPRLLLERDGSNRSTSSSYQLQQQLIKYIKSERFVPSNQSALVSSTATNNNNNQAYQATVATTTSTTTATTTTTDRLDYGQQQQQQQQQQQLGHEDNNGECSRRNSHSMYEYNLLYCSLERMKLKDLGCEIRALMDVEQFVHQAILLLEVNEIVVEDIVDSMLKKIISVDKAISKCVINEARNALFIHKSASLLARTIQGIHVSTDPMVAGLDYDQSWLCSICNLPTISKRHVAIARLKHLVNMGKNAHEVRFFIMIVTPSKEKGTKNALETGRTFATIFSDINFRQILLNVHNETEFKQALLTYTRRLANAKSVVIDNDQYVVQPPQSDNHTGQLCKSMSSLAGGSETTMRSSNQGANSLIQIVENRLASLVLGTDTDPNTVNTVNNNNDNNKNSNNNSIKGYHEVIDDNNNNITISYSGPGSTISRMGSGGVVHTKSVCLNVNAATNPRNPRKYYIGNGLCADIRRRYKFLASDFTDGLTGPKTVHKTVSTIVFLYFGILLPTIAFGVLNTTNTDGHLGDIRKAIIGQAIGGFVFALVGGQPLVIIMTTAPLCLYTKVIYTMCQDYNYPFLPMYAAVGLWNGLFLTLYSLFDVSRLMKWCTRSTEEIFALFIAMAFGVDAGRDLIKNFNRYYYSNACLNDTLTALGGVNGTHDTKDIFDIEPVCRRESSLLFIILMFGTLWLGLALYNFNKTPYLQASKREILADYALPSAVILMSFVGSYVFEEIYVEKFTFMKDIEFVRAQVSQLPLVGLLLAMVLGFTLSLLFFMDQNISAAMVNSPQNKLKKGCAYHYDLLVVGLLNCLLTLYGLPMMHGVLPHSPLHVRSLADVEERVESGHVHQIIINVRETRITGIVAHTLISLSIFLIPYPIAYIPTAVLDGLFLYMAVTSLDGLQMFERITLLFTEQSAYPPNHYIRRCPQRKIHEFTLVQLFQLTVMCFFGFSPSNTIEMFFPVAILLMLPFRHKLVPHYIEDKYLDALDGKH